MTQDPSPHEALASIRDARAGLAPPADYPLAYDLAYGAICALLVAGQGLPQPWSFIVLPIAACTAALASRPESTRYALPFATLRKRLRTCTRDRASSRPLSMAA